MSLDQLLVDDAATPSAYAKRNASGDIGFRRVALPASNGGLDNLGYLCAGVVSKATSFVIDDADVNGLLFASDATSGNIAVTLPAAGSHTGRIIGVLKTDATVNTVGGFTANAAVVTLRDQLECVLIQSDGALWKVIGWYKPNEPLQQTIVDPGNAGAISVTRSGHVDLVSTGAETRTLAAPSYKGQTLLLNFKTDGGDCVVTCSTTINQTGNNTITFNDAGDCVLLVAKTNGSNTRWSVVSNDGAALSTV